MVCGSSFNCEVAHLLLDLQKDGVNGFDVQLFWHDKDHVTDDLVASYTFFVVYKDEIIREEVIFCDSSGANSKSDLFSRCRGPTSNLEK